MYVCLCNAVTEKMIRQAVADGVSSLDELTRLTGCSGACGGCVDAAAEVLQEARERLHGSKPVPFALPLIPLAA